jgi:hypothetical protein
MLRCAAASPGSFGHHSERAVHESEVVVVRGDADLVAAFLAEGETALVAENRVVVPAPVPVDRAHEVVGLRDLGRVLLLVEQLVHDEAVFPRAIERPEAVLDPRDVVVELGALAREQLLSVRAERSLEELLRLEELPPLLEDLALPPRRLHREIPETGGIRLAGYLLAALMVEGLRLLHAPRERKLRPEIEVETETRVGWKRLVEPFIHVARAEAVECGDLLPLHERPENLEALERRLVPRPAPDEVEECIEGGGVSYLGEEPRDVSVNRLPAFRRQARQRPGGYGSARRRVHHRESAAREARRLGARLYEAALDEALQGGEDPVLLRREGAEQERERHLESEHGEKGENRTLVSRKAVEARRVVLG